MASQKISKFNKTERDVEDGLDDDGGEGERRMTKAKRHDIEVPMAEVDIKLAERLDNILKISDKRRPRFFMNKPKPVKSKSSDVTDNNDDKASNDKMQIRLKHRDLDRGQLKQRLAEKYETLVPELDPKRPVVKLVKVLSATESLELAKGQAKKQLEHQLELSSVSGNQLASKNGIGSFKFRDGYELPPKCFWPGKKSLANAYKHKSVSFASNGTSNGVMATVKYFKPDENEATSSEHDTDSDDDDEDETETDDLDDDDDADGVDDDHEMDDADEDNADEPSLRGKKQSYLSSLDKE